MMKSNNKINLAIVGATGLVGSTFLKVLEERVHIKINKLFLYASKKSANKIIVFRKKEIKIIELNTQNIKNKKIDYVLFSAGANISKQYANDFVSIGAKVIDNSSAFRMIKEVPLIVPEVNGANTFNNCGIIANPNCSTIQCMAPLNALKIFNLKQVHFTTYQAVSGSGMKGLKDLEQTTKGLPPSFYPHPIFNNCIPQIDDFTDNGYTKEEMKMINETKKILNMPNLKISATCVRVPIQNSHSVEIYAEFKKDINVYKVKELLKRCPQIIVQDDIKNAIYPLATTSTNTDAVYVGRIRKSYCNKKALHLWCCADNIRKGAASNAISILELFL